MDIKKKLQELETNRGFFNHNNYHVEKIEKDKVILRADITEDSMNPYGGVHGGLIFGLCDTVMGMAAAAKGKIAVTVDSNISYHEAANGRYILAEGKVVRDGKNICFLESKVYNDKKLLVATATATYYYIDEEKEG